MSFNSPTLFTTPLTPLATAEIGLSKILSIFEAIFDRLVNKFNEAREVMADVEGLSEEELSGNAVVNVYQDGSVPTIAFSKDASKTITLDCGASGIALGTNAANATNIPRTSFPIFNLKFVEVEAI